MVVKVLQKPNYKTKISVKTEQALEHFKQRLLHNALIQPLLHYEYISGYPLLKQELQRAQNNYLFLLKPTKWKGTTLSYVSYKFTSPP